jgi:hypothetical protein
MSSHSPPGCYTYRDTYNEILEYNEALVYRPLAAAPIHTVSEIVVETMNALPHS